MLTYTVVIPVYNAEKYLESCIASVLAQNTTSEYEIILVNDGSKDGSAQICDCYAAQRSCIKVIHQSNQGVSVARNTGIEAAQGQYVLFLDADDLWDSDLLAKLDAYLCHDPDMIEFGYRKILGDRIHETVLPAHISAGESGTAYFEAHAARNSLPIAACWASAFRRQFLEKHNLRFSLGVSYGEDFLFHMQCLKCAHNVVSIAIPLYEYRLNEQSVTYNLTVKKMRDRLSACAQVYHLFPCVMLADHFCIRILGIAKLSRNEAVQLYDFLAENREILRAATGRKARVACFLYSVLGWYNASRLVRMLLQMRYAQKG